MNDHQNAPEITSISKDNAKKYFLRLGLGILMLPLISTVLQYAAVFAVAAFAPSFYDSWQFPWILSTVPLYCAAYPIFLFVLPKPIEKTEGKRSLKIGGFIAACIIAVSAMYIFNIVGMLFVDAIRDMSGGRLGGTDALNSIVNSSPTWVTVAIVCLIGPIMEELIFRKAIIDRALPFGEFRACLLSALVFGLFHGNFRQLFYATAIGFVFAYVYVKTRNIFFPIGMHIGVNILGSVVVPKLLSNKNLEVVERVAVDPANMTNSDANIVLLVFGTIVIGAALIISGVVLFFVLLRKIKFDAPKYSADGGKETRSLFLNLGIIAAYAVMAVNFVLSLLS